MKNKDFESQYYNQLVIFNIYIEYLYGLLNNTHYTIKLPMNVGKKIFIKEMHFLEINFI